MSPNRNKHLGCAFKRHMNTLKASFSSESDWIHVCCLTVPSGNSSALHTGTVREGPPWEVTWFPARSLWCSLLLSGIGLPQVLALPLGPDDEPYYLQGPGHGGPSLVMLKKGGSWWERKVERSWTYQNLSSLPCLGFHWPSFCDGYKKQDQGWLEEKLWRSESLGTPPT